ncbi:hypothetical protein HPP92_009712 [Vanilla planifolia]|uniref:Uncharacterized protein n=1 Tax=Vanilla planifolia TaxID=51239 RepID=A0A835V5Q2_VANPL|nr:hypothetical protein HPP92_009712 [Vanilla planifolia]
MCCNFKERMGGAMQALANIVPSISQVVNAAVIIDPSNEQIVATANDQTFNGFATFEQSSSTVFHPETIKNHLGNSAECSELKFLQHDLSSVSCLYPWHWIKQQLDCNNSEEKCEQSSLCHPLRHAVLVAIENASARDRQLYPWVESQKNLSPLSDYICRSLESLPSKRQKTQTSENLEIIAKDGSPEMPSHEATQPYLCTGFDAYIVWEPCAMCAMALVHQRVRRVFYAFPNQNAGALGSVHRLQGEKSLNHHYSVFRVLKDEENLERN